MTYNDNIMVLISFIENNQSKVWEANRSNFPNNSWGGVNALTKKVVRDLIEQSQLSYTKELGSFVKKVVNFPNIIAYSQFKRELIGLTIEEVVFGD